MLGTTASWWMSVVAVATGRLPRAKPVTLRLPFSGTLSSASRPEAQDCLVRAGRAVRKYKAVKSDGPNDLVFQSVKDGKAMRDNNILSRFIKPAARKVGLGFVNWRCLRTSYGTWLKRHGADMKDIQGQMRHSRMSTTADIYVQDIPESRRRAVEGCRCRRQCSEVLERFGT